MCTTVSGHLDSPHPHPPAPWRTRFRYHVFPILSAVRSSVSLSSPPPYSPPSLNRLCELPRGFGSFPALEILDLTYNNLTNASFSANFTYLGGNYKRGVCVYPFVLV